MQLSLQGSPVQIEFFCGQGDVAVAVGEHAIDVFPFGPGQGRGRELILAHLQGELGVPGKGGEYVINISRFGQVIERPQPDSLGGRGDAALAGEDDNLHIGVALLGRGNEFQARSARHFQIKHPQVRTLFADNPYCFIEIAGCENREAPLAKSLCQPFPEPLLIVNQNNRLIHEIPPAYRP